MNFQDLTNLVLSWLDDPNGTYFTPAQTSVWINNGQNEVQKLLLQAGQNFYLKPVQTLLVFGQQDYVLPYDFRKEHRLELVVSGVPPYEATIALAPITLNQQDLVPNQTGQPQFYSLKKNRVTVYPTPDGTSGAYPFRLYYSYMVKNMVNPTDVPDVPSEYHEFIAVLATIDGLLKDQRDPTPMLSKRAYYENMLKQDANERLQDSPRSIVRTGEDAGFPWYYL